jgi:hypothetical protein
MASLGNGVLTGIPLDEASLGRSERPMDRSERTIFLIASCISLVRGWKIIISLSIVSIDCNALESAVDHVVIGEILVQATGAFDLMSETN